MQRSIEFLSQGYKIQGAFYLADVSAATHTALLLPGFPGAAGDVLDLGQRLSKSGIHTMTFNYRGTHGSEGTFSLKNTLEDIQAAYAYLHQGRVMREFQIPANELLLGGYSFGGGMAVVYTANHPEIKRVFSISGTDHGEFAREYERNPALAEALRASYAELKFPTGPVNFAWQDAEDVVEEIKQNPGLYDLKLSATALADRDILLIGGWDDMNVILEQHILPLYRALVERKARMVQIAAFQDDHAFERCREELAATVVHWAKPS